MLPSLLIMFIPSTFKRPVSSSQPLNLRKTLLIASHVRLKPLNCSRLPFVYAQETLTFFFFFNDTATTEIYTLSLHDALPISSDRISPRCARGRQHSRIRNRNRSRPDRKSTRLNSSHLVISYAVFCLKKKNAAVIAYYVHPVNIQTACLIFAAAEFTENIINCVARPVKAAELFAFTFRVRAGNTDVLFFF